MKIIEINTTNFGSTSSIMLGIAVTARKMGREVIACFPASRDNRRKVNVLQILTGNQISCSFYRDLAIM